MLTLGVVAAALADAAAKGQSLGVGSHLNDNNPPWTTSVIGFTILALAMILSAFQGMYADQLYETHGRGHWKEALFYSHALSLPCFLPTFSQLSSQLRFLSESPPLLSYPESISSKLLPTSISTRILSPLLLFLQESAIFRVTVGRIPIRLTYLLLNALTQYVCIRGVHLLAANSSSLTVTIVLNVRKLVSLLLSIYVFGNDLASGILVGAVFVFFGGGLYGIESARLRKRKSE